MGAKAGTEAGMETGVGSRAGTGAGMGTGAGAKAGTGAGMGMGVGAGAGAGAKTGAALTQQRGNKNPKSRRSWNSLSTENMIDGRTETWSSALTDSCLIRQSGAFGFSTQNVSFDIIRNLYLLVPRVSVIYRAYSLTGTCLIHPES